MSRAYLRCSGGGTFRISLTYDSPTGVGKTTAHTDTYRGRFIELVPNERVVEIDDFETENPALRGEMKITIELADKEGAEVVGVPGRIVFGASAVLFGVIALMSTTLTPGKPYVRSGACLLAPSSAGVS